MITIGFLACLIHLNSRTATQRRDALAIKEDGTLPSVEEGLWVLGRDLVERTLALGRR